MIKKGLLTLKTTIEKDSFVKNIFILFIGLFFLSDFITKILIVYDNSSFNRIAGVVKLIFELLMIIFLFKKRKINFALILGAVLLLAFLISNFSYIIINECQIDYKIILENIYYANRYLYVFIFIAFLKEYNIPFSFFFIKLFKTVLYINSVLIIVGFLLKMELFRSYVYTSRFGYDGIFSKHGEAAYYYMFFISILYYEYYISNRLTSKLLKVIAISLVSILLGKKTVFLFLFFLLITHMMLVVRKLKFLGATILFSIAGFVYFRETILDGVFKMSPFWEAVYKNHGFIGGLTSTRSELLVNFINYFVPNWNILNYLFGIGEYETHKVEFEFVDVFMFFGFTGIIVYIYLFKKYFYNKNNKLSICLLFSILITSFFSGALFISVTGMMFFYVIFQWINSSE